MKSTKKCLISSVLALIMCVCMLIGTTFAWFTDSVTSGKNRIVAGNLDVEVYHTNAFVKAPKTSIAGESNMFCDVNGNAILWEPGVVSFENLTIANVGNLALKYKINMNVVDYNMMSDTGDNLKQALKVKILTGEDMLSDVSREAVLALDWTDAQTIEGFSKEDGVLYPEGTAGQSSEDKVQLIVYWEPTDNDNRWNVNNGKTTTDGEPLFIDFGINLVATQKDYENDSFNNQYDVIGLPNLPKSINKTFETPKIGTSVGDDGKIVVKTVDGENASGIETVQVINKSTNTGVGTVTKASVNSVVQALVDQIVAGGTPADKIDITSDQNSIIYIDIKTTQEPTETEAEYDISLSAKIDYTDADKKAQTAKIEHLTEEQLGGNLVTAKLNIGPNLKNVQVKHDGTPMEQLANETVPEEGFYYNTNSGDLIIKSKSFSPFQVTYENDNGAADGAECYVGTTPTTLAEAIANAPDNTPTTIKVNKVIYIYIYIYSRQ